MPDWSFHTIFKPLLFKLPPKKARDLTFGALTNLSRIPFGSSLISFLGHMEPPEEIKKSMLGIEFFSPVGLDGRLDPHLNSLRAMVHFGFGFLTVGPVTLKPINEGWVRQNTHNEEIEYERIDANSGLEETYKFLSNLNKNGCKLMIKVRYKGNLHEMNIIMDRLLAIADVFIIEGIAESEAETFRSLKERYYSIPILIGIQTQCNNPEKYIIMESDGIIFDDASGRPDTGYVFGRGSKPRSLELIRNLRKKNTSIPIIASGGVTEPQDALDLLDAGADLIQVHSGLVNSGPGLPKRINESLAERSRTPKVAPSQYISRSNDIRWFSLYAAGERIFILDILTLFICF